MKSLRNSAGRPGLIRFKATVASTETPPPRIVTAAALFDGHDAAINVMRRLIQAQGAEVVFFCFWRNLWCNIFYFTYTPTGHPSRT